MLTAARRSPAYEVVTIETPSLGDRSYVVHDGADAVVIDPQRDIERVLTILADRGVRLAHVLETHIHNDYVTGGLALARETGAAYVVAAGEDVGFSRVPVRDGDELGAGRLSLTVVHTPGHTPGHLSYVLREGSGDPVAVFTGGSMLFGAVGRTDLIAPDQTEPLTHAQYRSVRRLAEELPDNVAVYPTHGFGSFCSATPTTGTSSTIGGQRRGNTALTSDEATFVTDLIAGLGAYPRYYAQMGPQNRRGPTAADRGVLPVTDGAELHRRIAAGEWVVDVRERRAFAKSHARGTISVELGNSFGTFLGWVMPWDAPVTLIGDSEVQLTDARRQLARIGIDQVSGGWVPDGVESSYPVAGFADLARAWDEPGLVVLDVRRPDEWRQGHLDGAVHVPFWELPERAGDVPAGEVWVHCASGMRSSIGASVLDRAGRDVVYIDDEWERAAKLGLPVVS
jgi:glyoxylase-like metal-dependent hydrolase (beta-lactamase superfamily II)/rhodanese-related sulfurtransferase